MNDRKSHFRRLAKSLLVEPLCPDCHVGVDRPKCFFEMGGDCPRHELKNLFNSSADKLAEYLENMENAERNILAERVFSTCLELEKMDQWFEVFNLLNPIDKFLRDKEYKEMEARANILIGELQNIIKKYVKDHP